MRFILLFSFQVSMQSEYADRIKQLSDIFGSSKNLSVKCDIDPRLISKYKNKQSIPGGEVLTQIFLKTGCNPAWLLTGEGEPFAEEQIQLKDVSIEEKLSKSQSKLFKDFIKVLDELPLNHPLMKAITNIIDSTSYKG